MEITRLTVEVLDTPLESGYVAAGNAVSSNYHILSRIETKSGVQGIGFAVATRPALVKSVAAAARELGQLLPGLNVLEREAARAQRTPGGVHAPLRGNLQIPAGIEGQPLAGSPKAQPKRGTGRRGLRAVQGRVGGYMPADTPPWRSARMRP